VLTVSQEYLQGKWETVSQKQHHRKHLYSYNLAICANERVLSDRAPLGFLYRSCSWLSQRFHKAVQTFWSCQLTRQGLLIFVVRACIVFDFHLDCATRLWWLKFLFYGTCAILNRITVFVIRNLINLSTSWNGSTNCIVKLLLSLLFSLKYLNNSEFFRIICSPGL